MSIIYNTLQQLEADEQRLPVSEARLVRQSVTKGSNGWVLVVGLCFIVLTGTLLRPSAPVQSALLLTPEYGGDRQAQETAREFDESQGIEVDLQVEPGVPLDNNEEEIAEVSPETLSTETRLIESTTENTTETKSVTEQDHEASDSSEIVAIVSSQDLVEENKPSHHFIADVHEVSVVDEAIGKARIALANRQYGTALAHLQISVPEERPDYWLIKGSVHLGIGELEEAQAALGKAQSLGADSAQISVQRAIIYQEQDQHDVAIFVLQQALLQYPESPEILLNLGYSQFELDDLDQAERSFRAYVEKTEGRSLYAHQRLQIQHWLEQLKISASARS